MAPTTLSYCKRQQNSKHLHKSASQSFHFLHRQIFLVRINMSNNSCNLRTIVMPHVSIISKRPIVTCFASQLLEIKLTTTTKMSCIPFDIHRSNAQLANTQLANVGCTYMVMIFSTKLGKTNSAKTFLNGKTTREHNLYDNL